LRLLWSRGFLHHRWSSRLLEVRCSESLRVGVHILHGSTNRSKRGLQILVHGRLGVEILEWCLTEERGRSCALNTLSATLVESIRHSLCLRGRERILDSLIVGDGVQAWHSLLARCNLVSLHCERVHRSVLSRSLLLHRCNALLFLRCLSLLGPGVRLSEG